VDETLTLFSQGGKRIFSGGVLGALEESFLFLKESFLLFLVFFWRGFSAGQESYARGFSR
jgi:hypothetical protein